VLWLVAVTTPLDSVAEDELLSAHMLQHVLLGDLVPVLLVLALSGPLLFFVVPARIGRLAASIGPVAVFAVWVATLALWHVPAVYQAALTRPLLHDAEHLSFFVAGLLLWTQLLDPARRGTVSLWGGVALAASVLAAGQLLANTLVLTSTLVYPAYDGAFGISARSDQDAAGLVMMVEQLLTLGAFVVWRVRSALRAPVELREESHPLAL
jgi:cytochrome c oxidase assembly factor CtaG